MLGETAPPDPGVIAGRERQGRVSRLPPRIAEVGLALVQAWTEAGGVAPVTTHHVWQHDSRALSVGATSSVLSRAVSFRLVRRAGRGQWSATDQVLEIRGELEARILGEEKAHG
jgi:hypothetical protein